MVSLLWREYLRNELSRKGWKRNREIQKISLTERWFTSHCCMIPNSVSDMLNTRGC